MQQTTRYFFRTIVGAALCSLTVHASWAQSPASGSNAQASDPARWYQEDMTPRAHFQTSKKEAGAAYDEARTQCRNGERMTRNTCLKEARMQFEQAMAEAGQKMQMPRR